MRIISGKFKKSILYLPKKINFRPTSDFIKEGLFSSIQNSILNCTFLDLFSGSGSIGLEAISRGAKKVYFVDSNLNSIKILKKNLKLLNVSSDKYFLFRKDYKKAIKDFHNQNIKFDIIFADPPYEKDFMNEILECIENLNIMNKEAILIIEHSKRENCNFLRKILVLDKVLEYGDTKISFFKRR